VPVHKLNDSNDPVELKEEVKQIFDDWIRLSDESPSEESHDSFVASLQQIGFLKVLLTLQSPAKNTILEIEYSKKERHRARKGVQI
jgi:hypothetical protein